MSMNFFFKVNNIKYWHTHLLFGQHISVSTLVMNTQTCLDLIHHNIGITLKHNKYIFDISIPFCHHLYLSATSKPCFTWFAGNETSVHTVYRWTQHQIPTCDLIGQLFWCSIAVFQNEWIVTILRLCYNFLRRIYICVFVFAS